MWLGYERVMTKVPGCVIMPRTTEQVQKIVKVCNATKSPTSHTAPDSTAPVLIHILRMLC